jgi:hypothetical protein
MGGPCYLQAPHRPDTTTLATRLWIAEIDVPESLFDYLQHHGFPIRYGYVAEEWPLVLK